MTTLATAPPAPDAVHEASAPSSAALAALARIDSLVERLERAGDPTLRAVARDLVAAVLEFHALGLSALLRPIQREPSILALLTENPGVAALLVLHSLHPEDPRARARAAVKFAAGELEGSGLTPRILDASETTVRVHVDGKASALASAKARGLIHGALQTYAPEFGLVEITGLPPAEVHLAQLVSPNHAGCGCHSRV